LSWRIWTDRLKRSDRALRLADWLGRGRGRMRWFDHLHTVRRPPKPDLSRWHSQKLSAVWIGHATVLLRIGDLTILTDPVLTNRVGVGLGLVTAGPHRLVAPALSAAELPPIDVILVSHAHFDHLDRPTLCRLPKDTPVITAHHTLDLIRDLGFRRVAELQWGESLELAGVSITARQVRHWGARTFFDAHRGFNAYLLQSSCHRVLYGGDSAYHDHFADLGRVDLAILGIGGYDPYVAAHATPEQAWAMANHMNADHLLPMHHSTFRLSHEPVGEPMERILDAAGGRAAERIVVREVGGQWSGN
jgi:L-ascorbate metabolism protein UlaG (beta-lactamase superfamily)